jgi:thiamine transport system permease protein
MRSSLGWLSLALSGAFLATFLAAPVAYLIWSHGTAWDILLEPYYQRRLLWTLEQALLSTLLVGLIALPTAWLLPRTEWPGRKLYRALLLLPFLTPVMVAAMGFNALLGPRGWFPVAGDESPALLICGNVFYNLGLVVWFLDAAFRRIPPRSRAAARSLGAPSIRVFRRVEWPLVRPTLMAALCLTFLFCVSSFGLALLLAGRRYATLEVEIYTLTAYQLDLASAAALALVQLAICVVAALSQARLDRATPLRIATGDSDLVRPAERLQGVQRVAAITWLLLVGVLTAAPFLALLVSSLRSSDGWSLSHYARLAGDEDLRLALTNSIRFALLTVIGGGLLGILVSAGLKLSRHAQWLAYAPYLLSGTVLAIGYLILFPGWSASLVILIVAYSLLAYPFVARQLALAWQQMSPSWLAAARNLGATPLRAAWRVLLPLLWPALRQGLALAGASALGEFAVNLFLARPEWLTLPRLIYERLGRPGAANLGEAQSLSILLLILAWLCLGLVGGARFNARRS